MRLYNKVQEAATTLMRQLNVAISTFMDAIGVTGGCDAQCKFNQLGSVVQQLPNTAEKLFSMVLKLDEYVGPNATMTVDSPRLRRLLRAVYSITFQAHNDIQRMYTLVYDTVIVTLPGLAVNITGNARLILQAIEALPDCPVAATFALMTAKDQIEGDIATILALKAQFEDAFFISTGELPAWLSPTKDFTVIITELVLYLGFHSSVMQWDCDAVVAANPPACQINRKVYEEEVSVDSLLGELNTIGDIVNAIQSKILPPISTATELYSDICTSWDKMKRV